MSTEQDKSTLPSAGGNPLATSTGTVAAIGQPQSQGRHHLWLVTGPAGCGKTTVAEYLANALNFPFIEGDQYHSPANIAKMSKGEALTDADRWDWLTELRTQSNNRIHEGSGGVVVTCSALKRKYRDVIRVAPYYDHSISVHFIFLHASQELLLARVAERQGHFMGAGMVQSQFDILELPGVDEVDVITIDASRSMNEVMEDTLSQVRALLTTSL